MKHKTFYKILLLLFLLAAAGFALALYLRHFSLDYVPSDYTESTDALSNPYQGFYHLYGYTLSETPKYTAEALSDIISRDKTTQLAQIQINLREYPSGPIGSNGLSQLDLIFSAWAASGKQLIVRFLYDWDGKALASEPESIDIILEHMTQVSSVVNQYSKNIYLLQGIFLGNNGEMHHSNYMSEENMRTLASHLASVTDSSIFLSVRTPRQWRSATGLDSPFKESDAFDGTMPSRLGLYNDGMLGSGTDTGTYASTDDREREIRFQSELCRFVPNGGEVIIENPYNDLPNAISDLSSMHVSYLNSDYDAAVLDKWKQSTYTDSGVFQGISGYDYIHRHLGYRYVLRSSGLSFRTFQDETASLAFLIENVGFSNTLRAFDLEVLVRNTETSDQSVIPIKADLRSLYSGQTLSLSVPLDIRSYGTGSYQLYLKITDPITGAAIQLANTLPSAPQGYLLGSLEIRK